MGLPNRLRATLLTLALGMTMFAFMPSSGAQFEGQLILRMTAPPRLLDEDQLQGGRLPAHTPFRVQLDLTVELPPVTGICPLGTITVSFSIAQRPEHSVATITPSAATKNVPFQPLSGGAMAGFLTQVTINQDARAPAFHASEYKVMAVASPSAGTSGGCILRASNPFYIPIVVVNDYEPGIEATGDVWIGPNPEPIHVVNHANGDTVVRFSYGTAAGWVPSNTQVLLESEAISGQHALDERDVTLPKGEVPEGFNGNIRISGRAMQTGQAIRYSEVSLSV